jgi:tagatose 1,6-diphosphate aldolase
MAIEGELFEPTPLRDGDLVLQFVRLGEHPVHKAPTYWFQMIHGVTGEELGGINLRYGSTPHLELYAGHIGFAVHPAHRGHRYASRSLTLLVPVAKKLKLKSLWITCDPDNVASRRSLELAGAQFTAIVEVPEGCIIRQAGHPQKCRYRIDLDDERV